jgi:pyridoxal phosphate enzyme (YggS family)
MPDRIEHNLRVVLDRVAAACRRAGRETAEVLLVAVTKTFPAATVTRAVELGIQHIGENRVQELREKAEQVGVPVRWHLIGHLQSNKAGIAARICEVVQTVDSVSLAQKLSREAKTVEKTLEVFIQVNIGGETQKSGVDPSETAALARSIAGLPHLRLRGLMTMPPLADAAETRRYFRRTRELRDSLRAEFPRLTELSMGMSDDYQIAIEEGSTLIRLGRALFGERA